MSAAAEEEESSVAPRRASSPSSGDWAAEEEDRNGQPRRRAEGAAEAAAAEESEARQFALRLALEAGAEVQEVEESIEEMLIRLDEFCGMTDMIRSDTSQLLDEAVPLIKAKMIEMNNIYMKVDKLEAFVKMVGQHVSFLEEQVLQAEKAHAVIPYTVRKLFGSAAIPLFNKKCTSSPQHTYSLPELYRTEDYFPIKYIGSKYQNH
ncbi:PREDICTED: breast carcinoma-amplified sequence 4 [Gekko japonicus]|uniref:Breast carcinoma-amplified sequence 4 n=1 Tax=Gekko japonicus TaxID=146911 RepID=A0ABM1K3Y7_GEKJA|nr:PREDICTED: breast carcinoma-amplified sequence 4 [Gekko japonicus]